MILLFSEVLVFRSFSYFLILILSIGSVTLFQDSLSFKGKKPSDVKILSPLVHTNLSHPKHSPLILQSIRALPVTRSSSLVSTKSKDTLLSKGQSGVSGGSFNDSVSVNDTIQKPKNLNPKKINYLFSQVTIKASLRVRDDASSTTTEESTASESVPPLTEEVNSSSASSSTSSPKGVGENASKDLTEGTNTEESNAEDIIREDKETGTVGPEDQFQNTSSGTISLRHNCNFTDQCMGDFTECRAGFCKCALGFLPSPSNADVCGDATDHRMQVPRADPTMIGVVIGLVLMSVTMCIVFRLFARARFRENRTIFNTANPRLMNATMRKGPKVPKSRRGSQVSVGSGQIDPEAPGSSIGTPLERKRSRLQKHYSVDATHTGGRGSVTPSRVLSRSSLRQDSTSSHP